MGTPNFREFYMRKRKLRKALFLLAPGCLLWAGCPSGTFRFLAPTIQPALAQVFNELATVLTDSLLGTTP